MDAALLISIISITIVVLTFFRQILRDNSQDEQAGSKRFESMKEGLITVNVKLDQIFDTTSETKANVKGLDAKLAEMDKRVTIVENEVKQIREEKEK